MPYRPLSEFDPTVPVTPKAPEPTIKGYHALRRDVMDLADKLNERRSEMLVLIRTMNEGITKLVEYADKLYPRALEEVGANGQVKQEYRTHSPSPEDVAAHTNPRHRKCSNCGEPGHTARTCSNERKPRHGEYRPIGTESTTLPKKKRTMKPLTEEQKQKRRDALVKARAARGRK